MRQQILTYFQSLKLLLVSILWRLPVLKIKRDYWTGHQSQVDWCASGSGYRSGQNLSTVKICGVNTFCRTLCHGNFSAYVCLLYYTGLTAYKFFKAITWIERTMDITVVMRRLKIASVFQSSFSEKEIHSFLCRLLQTNSFFGTPY